MVTEMTDTPTTPTDVDALIEKAKKQLSRLEESERQGTHTTMVRHGDEGAYTERVPSDKFIRSLVQIANLAPDLLDALAAARSVPQPTGTSEEERIKAERDRQIAKGYTPEHDAAHGREHLIHWAQQYAVTGQAIKASAMLLALIDYDLAHPAAVPPAGAGREQALAAASEAVGNLFGWKALMTETPHHTEQWRQTVRDAVAKRAVENYLAALPSVPTPTVDVEKIARGVIGMSDAEPNAATGHETLGRYEELCRGIRAALLAGGGLSVEQIKADALREAREDFHDWEGVADVLDARAAALVAGTGEQP